MNVTHFLLHGEEKIKSHMGAFCIANIVGGLCRTISLKYIDIMTRWRAIPILKYKLLNSIQTNERTNMACYCFS